MLRPTPCNSLHVAAEAAAKIACGAWPHAAATCAAHSVTMLRPTPRNSLHVAAGHCRPFVTQSCTKQKQAIGRHARPAAVDPPIRSMTGIKTPSSAYTRRTDEFSTDGNSSAQWPEQVRRRGGGAWVGREERWAAVCVWRLGMLCSRLFTVDCGRYRQSGPRPETRFLRQPALEELTRSARTDSPRQIWPEQIPAKRRLRRRLFERGGAEAPFVLRVSTCVTLNGSGIQLAVGPQPLRLRNHNFGLAHRIMVKRLATSPHDPLCITDSALKNHLVVLSVQYGPFNTYISIRSTTIDNIGYPRIKASGESSTTKHRLLHASGPHPIPPPNDPKRQFKSASFVKAFRIVPAVVNRCTDQVLHSSVQFIEFVHHSVFTAVQCVQRAEHFCGVFEEDAQSESFRFSSVSEAAEVVFEKFKSTQTSHILA
ncbi:hypothetical protein F511_36553 [Dorcoceras hygrometricum]|uniref:Uncharacterized protein n=1 Tax=Dorcoceras hygrometricum TaxID=472368 RepID=A0A2Z7AZR1_9LAMI|nr:hypothetical protein F511_36553 [Dorcoceras hygrometricum]